MAEEVELAVRFPCPCCGYPTLEEPASHEICAVCDWQDDGQGDDDADKVFGGPNSDLSLSSARKKFVRTTPSPAEMEPRLRRDLFEAYERWKLAPPSERDSILPTVLQLEAALLEDMAMNAGEYFSRSEHDA